MDKKQEELDRVEEYVLTKILGDINNPIISSKIQMYCVINNIDIVQVINNKIQEAESLCKKFMTDEGYFDGEKITKALTLKYPSLSGIDIPTVKPMELFVALDNLIGFESIGYIVQNL